jgi:hypothetical protein
MHISGNFAGNAPMIGCRRGLLGPVLDSDGDLFTTNGLAFDSRSKNLIVATVNDDANTLDERFVHH